MSFLKISVQIKNLPNEDREDLFKHLLVLGRECVSAEELERCVYLTLEKLNDRRIDSFNPVMKKLIYAEALQFVTDAPTDYVLARDTWNNGTFVFVKDGQPWCIRTAAAERPCSPFDMASYYSRRSREWVVLKFPKSFRYLLQ